MADKTHPRETRAAAAERAKTGIMMISLIKDFPNGKNPHNITEHAILEMRVEAAQLQSALTLNLDKIVSDVIKEADAINAPLADRIKADSKNDRKVVLRWGLGHFDKKDDVDERLGNDQTIVIATVLDDAELRKLQHTILNPKDNVDLPDYIYMPERTDTAGKTIPEKAISVAEYLEAQRKATQSTPVAAPPQSRERN